MIQLNSLKARLQNSVAARGGVPGDGQYEQAIRDAVADFNNAATRMKVTSLAIQSGTATYALPDDLVKFVKLQSLTHHDPTLVISSDGLIPISPGFEEFVNIEGVTLRITPTPTYTMTRELWYGAGHFETEGAYAEMTEREAAIILLLAQSITLSFQANVAAGALTSEQIGDERVTRESIARDTQKQADGYLARYREAVKGYVGTLTITE